MLISCPDQKGLVATISNFLYTHGANILHADQHQDNDVGMFFMRVEWDLDGFELAEEALRAEFAPIAERFQMRWRLHYSAVKPKMAIFVSRYLHCLADLLYRHQIGGMACSIPLVVSNHEDARALAEFHGVEFRHMPVDAAPRPKLSASR
jgi:formyltetrahydrofolate deformylase